jgi:hypothetical protein
MAVNRVKADRPEKGKALVNYQESQGACPELVSG